MSEEPKARAYLREDDSAGDPYLQEFQRLGEMASQAPDGPDRERLWHRMVTRLDAAIEASADNSAECIRLHLTKSRFLAHLALRDSTHRLAWVGGALQACQLSFEALEHNGDLRYATVSGWHAQAAAVLFVLRDLVDEPEPRDALEGIIGGYSQVLGISLDEELEAYEEGNARLTMAQVLDALIEEEEDPSARQWMHKDRQELAEGAFEFLARTSHLDLAYQAWTMAHQGQPLARGRPCPICGHENLTDSSFCVACGSPLPDQQTTRSASALEPCPACGASNQAGHRFCTKCGARL